MARRRMFSLDVIDTDKFLDMKASARLLYYELGMRADDEGFVSSPKRIMRTVGCTEEDLTLLIENGYVIKFISGVIVITHWKRHNSIQKDRFHKTIYKDELSKLTEIEGGYRLTAALDTNCIQTVSKTETEVSIGKDSLDKNSIDEFNLEKERTGQERGLQRGKQTKITASNFQQNAENISDEEFEKEMKRIQREKLKQSC